VIKQHDKKNVTMISTIQMKQTIWQASRWKRKSSLSVCWITTNTWAWLIWKIRFSWLIWNTCKSDTMKMFCRLLNIAVLNTMTIYTHNTGNKTDHISLRVQMVDGLSVQYRNAVKHEV
jgi:hypothetical protein